MSTISKKMCMIGDFGVGKTSLIRRFVDRQFSDQYLSTVGVKISRKTVELGGDKKEVQLLIWDLEGHTKFKGIAPSYLQGASGALIVADMSRTETIQRLEEHLDLFASVNGKGRVIIALNKSDLVDEDKGEKLVEMAQSIVLDTGTKAQKAGKKVLSVLSIERTSARTGLLVDDIFHKMADAMVEGQ